MLNQASNAYVPDYSQAQQADPSTGPLTPSISHLSDRLWRMTDTLSETLHRLRGPVPTTASADGPAKQEPSVAANVMNCHAAAGRLSNLLDELNGLI